MTTLDFFHYFWQDGHINDVYADAENGPSPDDIVIPQTPKQVWKQAHTCARLEAQGLHPFSPHPKEMEAGSTFAS